MRSTNNEIDFFELAAFLWAGKYKILAGAFTLALLSSLYAFLAPSIYESNAIIALKENQGGNSGGSSLLSQLGGFGGAVASQFGLMNSNLDRMEILLKGRELTNRVIDSNQGLMPRLYPKLWDNNANKWKSRDGQPPNKRRTIEMLRGGNLTVVVDAKKKTLRLSITSFDSTLSMDLAGYYRCFVQNFSSIAKPLTRVTEKSVDFEWDNDCEVSF